MLLDHSLIGSLAAFALRGGRYLGFEFDGGRYRTDEFCRIDVIFFFEDDVDQLSEGRIYFLLGAGFSAEVLWLFAFVLIFESFQLISVIVRRRLVLWLHQIRFSNDENARLLRFMLFVLLQIFFKLPYFILVCALSTDNNGCPMCFVEVLFGDVAESLLSCGIPVLYDCVLAIGFEFGGEVIKGNRGWSVFLEGVGFEFAEEAGFAYS